MHWCKHNALESYTGGACVVRIPPELLVILIEGYRCSLTPSPGECLEIGPDHLPSNNYLFNIRDKFPVSSEVKCLV